MNSESSFNRTIEDVGNIVHFEHVNLRQPDQQRATIFYVSGLGLTRDPYMMTGIENMWVNIGRNQIHLPTGNPQRLRGTIGLVVPDLDALDAIVPGQGAGTRTLASGKTEKDTWTTTTIHKGVYATPVDGTFVILADGTTIREQIQQVAGAMSVCPGH